MRTARIERNTAETRIEVELNLDGTGVSRLATGIGFFDHMLDLFAKHSLIDLAVRAEGDLHVDGHHTVEDIGLAMGKAVAQALGDKRGIRRYGFFVLPMDESRVTSAVDFGGRPLFVWEVPLAFELLGTFSSPLAEEFWRAFAHASLANLHVELNRPGNAHHVIEAVFKSTARAIRAAVEPDPRAVGQIPSTKGTLTD
jgi:imidazoleglycerol-phosphate dehydratase